MKMPGGDMMFEAEGAEEPWGVSAVVHINEINRQDCGSEERLGGD